MGTADRRSEILKILCSRRYEKMSNLAEELGVSERTIRRDIEVLSYTEPIYTRQGRYDGGVYVLDGYYNKKTYFSEEEGSFIRNVYKTASSNGTFDFYCYVIYYIKNVMRGVLWIIVPLASGLGCIERKKDGQLKSSQNFWI